MVLFSERYGYTSLSDVIIRETMTRDIENALCSCFDLLKVQLYQVDYRREIYKDLELYLWTNFLNNRRNSFFGDYDSYAVVATRVLTDNSIIWYSKLNLVEMSVKWLCEKSKSNQSLKNVVDEFTKMINSEFERLHYAYRFVGEEIVEITSNEEVQAVEDAMKNSQSNAALHLQSALELLAKKPIGDYRNSIKESISAVEAVCRQMTSKKTLGEALCELPKVGIEIPRVLKQGLEKLYGYTNNPDTGIRHALMDNEETYVPSNAEAVYMVVSCSAFINYLNAKRTK